MEILEIETFLAVAQHSSFSKAAVHLGYSQAAITVRIKNLEQETGVRLFDRLGKRVSLTSHGQVFYEHCLKIHNELEAAKESVKRTHELCGSIKIGTIDSLCASILPGIIRRFHEINPQIKINVTTDTPHVLLNMLRNNELDVVYVLDEHIKDADIVNVMEEKEHIVFAVSAEHPLADRTNLSIEDLLEYPFILTEKNASYRRVLDYKLITEKDVSIEPVFQSNNTDLLLNLIRHNSNTSIVFLPEFTVNRDINNGILKKLDVPSIDITIWKQVIHHKDKWITPEMQAFFDYLLDYYGKKVQL